MIKTYSQAKNIVENKFINSSYINSRNLTKGNAKYFPEEIHYWATKIINENLSESLFNSEFDSTYSSVTQTNLASIRYNDYIGQTFFIDSNSYPNGIFLADIKLFFATADSSPVTLELRPLVNGYPSSTDIIPLSSVTTTAIEYVNAAQSHQTDFFIHDSEYATIFQFEFPVYLSPGYYCFVVKTNSSKNSLYVAERGQPELLSNRIITNPYVGSLVTSQQGTSWTIEQTKDLCFILRRAKFEVGTRNFDYKILSPKTTYFDTLDLKLKTQEFDNIAFIDTITSTTTNASTASSSTKIINANKNIELNELCIKNSSSDVIFNISMTNTNDAVSPLVDLTKSATVLINYLIQPYSTLVSDSELTPSSGFAFAKYVTKQITLNENFDADGLTVYIDSNKPAGTEVEVFYKIQNQYDYSKDFSNLPWSRMTRQTPSQTAKSNSEFSEEIFQDLNITYSNDTGTVYTNFRYFAIKIVMYSNDPSIIPRVKNLRTIATV